MTTFSLALLSRRCLGRLVDEAPDEPAVLTSDHRDSLAARLRAVVGVRHRQLDAWSVERAGRPDEPFQWAPLTSRRAVGNAAARRQLERPDLSALRAVDLEVSDRLLLAADGFAREGSLAQYLASLPPAGLAVVRAEAANWATQVTELARLFPVPVAVADADRYYAVARARTTLRGRRDLLVAGRGGRVVVRVRGGSPGRSAGAGLRADLVVDALADPDGVAAVRMIGVWPDAGVVLAVDGTMVDLRRGARDLVRAAVALERRRLPLAA